VHTKSRAFLVVVPFCFWLQVVVIIIIIRRFYEIACHCDICLVDVWVQSEACVVVETVAYAHRKRPSVIIQELRIHNPTVLFHSLLIFIKCTELTHRLLTADSLRSNQYMD